MKTTLRFSLLFASLFYGMLLFGQAITGDLSINVIDPNGAAVSGAQLSLTSVQEGTVISGQSNSTGSFTFNQLRPGSYTLKITAEGFELNTLTLDLASSNRDLAISLQIATLRQRRKKRSLIVEKRHKRNRKDKSREQPAFGGEHEDEYKQAGRAEK